MPLDEADIAMLTKLFEAKLAPVVQTQTAITEQVAAQAAAMKAAQEAAKVAPKTKTEDKPADQPKADDPSGKKTDAERILEAKLAAFEGQLTKARADHEAAEAARKKDKLRMDVRSAIGQHFPAEVVDNVIAKLEYDGRIATTAEGNPALTYKRPFGEEHVPLEAALIEFRNSDEGKTFLPARGVSGTGDGIRTVESPLPLTQSKEVDWDKLKKQMQGRGGVTFGD